MGLFISIAMNEEILRLYKGMTTNLRKSVYSHFEQSPRVLLYLQLLEKNTTSTPKIVTHVYHDAIKSVDRRTLINRFYKLRSRVRVWLLRQVQHNNLVQTQEEQELAFLKLLVMKNEHRYAFYKLKELAEHCWTHNLFELLPEVVFSILKAGQHCGALNKEEQKALHQEWEQVNHLHGILLQFKEALTYLVLHIEEYSKRVNALRRLVKKLKAYPRFALMYHSIAFSMGVYREDLVERTSGAMVRHLNAFSKLQKEHPNIPIMALEPHHQERSTTLFCVREAIFWYYKNQPQRSMTALRKRQLVLKQSPDFFPDISSVLLSNLIYICIFSKDYNTAMDYIRELYRYQDANERAASETPALFQQMLVHILDPICAPCPNPQEVMDELEVLLEDAEGPSARACIILINLAVLHRDLERAERWLEHPYFHAYEAYCEMHQMPMYARKIVALVRAGNEADIEQFIAFVQQILEGVSSSRTQFNYETTIHVLSRCLTQIRMEDASSGD